MSAKSKPGKSQDELLRQLRESEELYRLTLSNITDTVFIVDDDGVFTFICPNVHFIFGYASEEVAALGTIERLFGTPVYDPEELRRHKEIRNIEHAITNKQGERHVLLINVKEVKIRAGTVLITCHDITELKEAELQLRNYQEELETLVAQRTNELIRSNRKLQQEISERTKVEITLREQKQVLENKTIALKELMEQLEIEKQHIRQNVAANADMLLLPLIRKLRADAPEYDEYLGLIEQNTRELTAAFGSAMARLSSRLTRREIDICNMVRNGLASKEIATLLNIAQQTVDKHRQNIRKKLGIANQEINLATHLSSLQHER